MSEEIVGDVIGADEVGQGALAGPLVVAAVAIKRDTVQGIRDSKLIKEAMRYSLADEIKEKAIAWKIVQIGHEFIDEHGIDTAWDKAMCTVLDEVRKEIDLPAIIDGKKLPTVGHNVRCFPKADMHVYQVAAASIVAKAHRDKIMIREAEKYPAYGFEVHKGYGTRNHLLALKRHGPCAIHRKSFRPVRNPDKPIPKEELEFDKDRALGLLGEIDNIDQNPFASDWEKQFVKDLQAKIDRGVRLSPRQMFFLHAVSQRRRMK
jgi:ribonuclease HII